MLKTERHEVALNRKTTDQLVQDHKQLELIAPLLEENTHARRRVSTAARENLGPGFYVFWKILLHYKA